MSEKKKLMNEVNSFGCADVVATNDNDPGTLVVVEDVEWIHRLMQGQKDKG